MTVWQAFRAVRAILATFHKPVSDADEPALVQEEVHVEIVGGDVGIVVATEDAERSRVVRGELILASGKRRVGVGRR